MSKSKIIDEGMRFNGDGFKALACMMFGFFKQNGGKNLVTADFIGADGERYEMTVQKVSGKPVAQVLNELKQQLAECKKTTTKKVFQDLFEVFGQYSDDTVLTGYDVRNHLAFEADKFIEAGE